MTIKSDLAYVDHILDCIRKIKEFSAGLNLKEFRKNELVQDAIIRNIEKLQKRYHLKPNKHIIKFLGKKSQVCETN